jgi:hypothetical protein
LLTQSRSFIEKTKNAKPVLLQLIARLQHARIYLANLRRITAQMTDPSQRNISIPFDYDECEATVHQLRAVVNKLGEAATAGELTWAMAWRQEQKTADKLMKQMLEQETHIVNTFVFISA